MARQPVNEADKRIGALVRAAREKARLTQSDLARHLGVTFQQVQKCERGTNRFSASRLQAVADRIGVPLSDLYEAPAPFEPRPLTVREAEAALRIAAEAYADAVRRAAVEPVTLPEAA